MSLWIMADSMVLVSNVLGLSLTLLQMMLLTKSTERLWSCGLFGSMILLTLASDILSIWISCSSTDFLLHEWFGVYQKIQLATYLVQICFHLMSSWLFVPKIVQFLAKDTKLVEHLVLKHQLSKFVFLVLAKCAAIVSIIYPKSGFYKNVPALYLCWQLDTLIETHCVLLEQPSKQRRASVFAQHLQQSS
ncbi:hypothetical protein EDD86DRAFT_215564 [Gorgonomyces haynaldii]|nr:hypothetical protein EDD86DRAFT_215564 [Gorgonomyces haynaldii]